MKADSHELPLEVMELKMGPSHPATHGTIKFNLKLDGEKVLECDVESHAPIGEYSVYVSGGGFPGAQINVKVDWHVPNFIGGLMAFLGGGMGDDFHGTSNSVFRQEGW